MVVNMENQAVHIGIKEGMISIDLPTYVVKAIGKRKTAIKLHIMKKDDKYDYFINDKEIKNG